LATSEKEKEKKQMGTALSGMLPKDDGIRRPEYSNMTKREYIRWMVVVNGSVFIPVIITSWYLAAWIQNILFHSRWDRILTLASVLYWSYNLLWGVAGCVALVLAFACLYRFISDRRTTVVQVE